MRHRVHKKILGRKNKPREMMMRSLASSLILFGSIKTTERKAKMARAFTERCLTRAKKGDLTTRKNLLKFFSGPVVNKLINDLAPKYKERQGGYLRIIRLAARKGDNSPLVKVEFI